MHSSNNFRPFPCENTWLTQLWFPSSYNYPLKLVFHGENVFNKSQQVSFLPHLPVKYGRDLPETACVACSNLKWHQSRKFLRPLRNFVGVMFWVTKCSRFFKTKVLYFRDFSFVLIESCTIESCPEVDCGHCELHSRPQSPQSFWSTPRIEDGSRTLGMRM